MIKALLAALFVGTIFCQAASAGQITLKNGDRLTGTIVKSDAKTLTIKSEFAGTITIQWDAIEQISSDKPLYLTLKDNQVIVGAAASTPSGLQVQTADAGTVTIAKDSIQLIRSVEEQAAHEAEIERLRNPGLMDLWNGAFDAGLSFTSGNADNTTFTLGMNAARTTPRDRIGVYATSLYAKNSTTGESLTTADAIRGGARYDVNITNRVFAFGFGDLEYDRFQKLDLRMVLGGGMGWHAVKTETTLFDLFGGGAFSKEYFSTDLKRTSGEALLGEELTHKLSDRVLFKERAVVFPNLSETGEYRLTFDSSLVTSINKWLGWHVTLSDRFLSNPVPGTKKNDVLLTTGIRLTFGR